MAHQDLSVLKCLHKNHSIDTRFPLIVIKAVRMVFVFIFSIRIITTKDGWASRWVTKRRHQGEPNHANLVSTAKHSNVLVSDIRRKSCETHRILLRTLRAGNDPLTLGECTHEKVAGDTIYLN